MIKGRVKNMENRGQVTVFLCLVLMSLLLLGITTLEMVRVRMGSAKAAEAADGAACEIQAAYNRELFDEYHLLAVDRTFAGQGEGKMEEMAEDYIEYMLDGSGDDDMVLNGVELVQCKGLLENDCENMKKQITEYMKIYIETEGIKDLLEMITTEKKAGTSTGAAIDKGQEDESPSHSVWVGTDPRDVLKNMSKGGVLKLVTPAGDVPSDTSYDMEPLSGKNGYDDGEQWEDIEFDDIDAFRKQVGTWEESDETGITDDFYGICYALETFNTYVSQKADRPAECEVEYMIAGEDNDKDNLKSVVNRIILHRLPLNMGYLLTDTAKMASVESIAFVLSLIPGVTYSAVKYLIAGCWAYVETLADIRCMLCGNDVKFIKSADTWKTDIDNLGDLLTMQNVNYEGADAIGYKGYLAILLAEKRKDMYYRMADMIQLNLSKDNELFEIKNMIYGFSIDVDIIQKKKYASFIESFPGVRELDEGYYRHSFRISKKY